MTISNILPQEGFLRLTQIIGQTEVTPEQAEANSKTPKTTTTHRHKRPRPGMPPIVPVSKTTWYQGIKTGIYPAPVHLGKTAVWRVSDIRALLGRQAA